jgi:hypothetical protein
VVEQFKELWARSAFFRYTFLVFAIGLVVLYVKSASTTQP